MNGHINAFVHTIAIVTTSISFLNIITILTNMAVTPNAISLSRPPVPNANTILIITPKK